MSITYGITTGLVTFGSDDFLDFIDAYFIEFGMMIFERNYLGDLASAVFAYVETIPDYVRRVYTWLMDDDDDKVFGKEEEVSKSSGSQIDFSDNDSVLGEINSDSERYANYEVLLQRD